MVLREIGRLAGGAGAVDQAQPTNRFDGAVARRSLDASLAALGVGRFVILYLHDPDCGADLSEVTGKGGSMEGLMRFREEGLATAVGLAAGRDRRDDARSCGTSSFDALITHNRLTVRCNRNAEPLLALAAERGVSVLNAAAVRGRRARQGARARALRLPGGDRGDDGAGAAGRGGRGGAGSRRSARCALQFSMRDPQGDGDDLRGF